jgi:2-polyprenyl-3-methyl-5-hydroxy-6-metoxy-1,4-benzoquinol methylase/ribosomal protein S27E
MKEEDIRPEKLFLEYLSLAKSDIISFFEKAPFYRVPCPACRNNDCNFVFQKSGFNYEECPRCHTLFANPRPNTNIFNSYYENAPSIKFWASHFYKETEVSRREFLIKPKAIHIKKIIEKNNLKIADNDCILDIGAGYGVFCEELRNLYVNKPEIIALEPSGNLYDICKKKGFTSIKNFFENLTLSDLNDRHIIAATSFELIEHLQDPNVFCDHCKNILPKGALLILTSLNWNGFDLQVLRDKSRSIQPPAHINFFTPKSISILLRNHGFEICEITTPGKLDVDIVSKQLNDINCSFIKTLLCESDDLKKKKIQKFLQEIHFSSHMMIVAKRI